MAGIAGLGSVKGSGASALRVGADVDLAFAVGPDRGKSLARGERLMAEGKERTPSFPFVSGDGFRAVCTVVVDETTLHAIKDKARWGREPLLSALLSMPPNATVFVKTELLDTFMGAVLPALERPFVLVTHNSDYSAPWEPKNARAKNGVVGEYREQRSRLLANPLVSVWYAQNAVVEHPKLVPLPIGIENRYNKYGAHVAAYAAAAADSWGLAPEMRDDTPFVGFSVKTNPKERSAALEAARLHFGLSGATTAIAKVKRGDEALKALGGYLRNLMQSRYVFAPKGHGLDTHRLWEALSVGCIAVTSPAPIMSRAPRGQLLSANVYVAHDGWSSVTPSALEAFLRSRPRTGAFTAAFDSVLDMNWWALEVNSHRHDAAA
jgi:hypothetical protein